MLKHLQELCNDNSSVVYSTHAPELIETTEDSYKHTFIAKNKVEEFQDTNIALYNLMSDKKYKIQKM